MPYKLIFIINAVLMTGFLTACTEEEPDVCEVYCEAESECAEVNHQKSSMIGCQHDCNIAWEEHISVHCGNEWEGFLECKSDLYCGEWGNFGEKCAYQIDRINGCLGSGN